MKEERGFIAITATQHVKSKTEKEEWLPDVEQRGGNFREASDARSRAESESHLANR